MVLAASVAVLATAIGTNLPIVHLWGLGGNLVALSRVAGGAGFALTLVATGLLLSNAVLWLHYRERISTLHPDRFDARESCIALALGVSLTAWYVASWLLPTSPQ